MADCKEPDPSAQRPASAKTWGGRFSKRAASQLESFSSSVHFDVALWREDVLGSIAHARMLGRQGIVSERESAELVRALEQVAREIEAGEMELDPALEDVHTNIERRVGEIAGAVAGKLHSGRSRNDQVATDLALWLRGAGTRVRSALARLREVLMQRAGREIDVVLPGYTHLQRAQPVRLAHHWLAYCEMLARDDARLRDAAARAESSPLGAGALAGSTLPLDRESTARELGFARPGRNSLDAVASRDAALELLSALSILMIHLSRLCEELVLWSSSEFGFVEMDDAFATGSSLMPQKKNPDVPELVRGKSGRVVGHLVSLLMTLKGLPLAYNRDLQEDKEPVFDAVGTVEGCLEILAPAIETLRIDAERMAAAAADPMLLATDLADHLVGEGMPFREAHEIVGRVVAHCLEARVPLDRLSRAELSEFHPALDLDPASFFSVERSLEARRVPGGPARAAVEDSLSRAREELARTRAELEEK
ncbi:MAG: argininosuccinate lyase [Proteobacteria bacterium]|nr:argininosuccinate lyase [Pseudomonadota bacterium]